MSAVPPARAFLILSLLLGGCREAEPLPTLRRTPLPAPATAGATLVVGADGVAWIGAPGTVTGVDPDGGVVVVLSTGGDAIPRVATASGERLLARAGGELLLLPRGGDGAVVRAAVERLREVIADPLGRWVYAVVEGGGVVAADTGDLTPMWGWPELDGTLAAAVVSPLGDRLYVALRAGSEAGGRGVLAVREAPRGRVVSSSERDPAHRALAAAGETTLVGVAGAVVERFRPGLDGSQRVWSRSLPLGDGPVVLRADRAGRRVAVFEAAPDGRLFLLDGGDGAVLGETEAPLDADFDAEGRLFLLETDAVRVIR
jgi:hypothetical protein